MIDHPKILKPLESILRTRMTPTNATSLPTSLVRGISHARCMVPRRVLCDIDSTCLTGCCATSIRIRFDIPHRVPAGSIHWAVRHRFESVRHATSGRCNHRITKASGSRPTIDSKCSPCPGGSGWQVPNHRRLTPCLGAESGYANVDSWCRATTRRVRVRGSYRTI